MQADYDIFEKLRDGSVVWRAFASGLEDARAQLAFLGNESSHEFFAINVAAKRVVARVNAPPEESNASAAKA
jgi:hypothetical protein